ncbi:MAG: DNA polymerase/3'-5' exonuclease PolX [Gemmatimonadaceae bacterium]
MDSRSAAHVLSQIAAFLELSGENRFKVQAYQRAARSLLALGADDLTPLLRSGGLGQLRGLGPATIAVVRDLVESGGSSYLERLREATPEGLLDLMRVPGLSAEKIQKLHGELGITSLSDLDVAAQEGRLAKVKGFGPRTAAKIAAGIAFVRDSGTQTRYHVAIVEASALLASVRSHPDVERAELAGSIRRRREVVGDIDIVAACSSAPERVAQSFTRIAGVRSAESSGGTYVSLRFSNGLKFDLYCAERSTFPAAWWRATGSLEHVSGVEERLRMRGLRLENDLLRDSSNRVIPLADEADIYGAGGLAWVAPELRENLGEIDAAARDTLPELIEASEILGVLHCHTHYSDGEASVADMAAAARHRGWRYLGISDHSQAAFYANGVSRERMLDQIDEIDALNAGNREFRILKGVEADILADGRLDYDQELLDRFDYVIASIHSRFKMDGPAMTERVLHAMDDPHMTILAHPTGRLLLTRQPYDLDLEAVFEKAAAVGVALEINADPHRLDLDWRYVRQAKEAGATIAIGPDAHAPRSLEWTDLGVSMARKGWLESRNVLNTRDADGVVAFAARRRR